MNSLSTASNLLESQGTPLSTAQLKYLERMLLGGMGSLVDFQLDEDRLGEPARTANRRIRSILENVSTYLHT